MRGYGRPRRKTVRRLSDYQVCALVRLARGECDGVKLREPTRRALVRGGYAELEPCWLRLRLTPRGRRVAELIIAAYAQRTSDGGAA